MSRAVLDSSTLISAFLTPRGTSSRVLRAARRGAFVLCLSDEILKETRSSLVEKTERIRRYYTYPDERIARYLHYLTATAEPVGNLPELRVVALDPKDDMVVATAVAAKADYLVSGDKRHLLPLGEYQGIKIVTARAFLELLGDATA